MSGKLGSNRYSLASMEEYWGERFTDATTVAASTITRSAGTWTANRYNGKRVRILDGTAAGLVYHIVSNTTTVITVQESTLVTDALASGDSMVFELENIAPGTINGWLGIREDWTPPDPEVTPLELWVHGGGQDRIAFVPSRIRYPSTIPGILRNWRFPFLAFGHDNCTGTDVGGGGGSTLNGAIKAGKRSSTWYPRPTTRQATTSRSAREAPPPPRERRRSGRSRPSA